MRITSTVVSCPRALRMGESSSTMESAHRDTGSPRRRPHGCLMLLVGSPNAHQNAQGPITNSMPGEEQGAQSLKTHSPKPLGLGLAGKILSSSLLLCKKWASIRSYFHRRASELACVSLKTLLEIIASLPRVWLSRVHLSSVCLSRVCLSRVGLSRVGLPTVSRSSVDLSSVGLSSVGLS